MILDKFFLKNEGEVGQIDPPGKSTLKKPSLITVNKGSGWIVELIESQYINFSIYRPLSQSSYIKLPVELKSPEKGLINIKNNDQKCFLWCHVRHINPVKIHPERITRGDQKLVNSLN